ncbi:LamG-like jellyroll fold domain-containing protein [Winogradskyella psychrotolerans]|uniref:LamG-like jellyroll fold domain-containing protein n=1 Tax=Winogradskyella psychrotolerans TaxID=1344585 RepID=UPI001C06A7BF|nr:LamG-like jellyroll fold domain-containing protein [Winogradskyella psychrotolerans]MBU2929406.1 T9SS type A sorting domain-containing protein [Winogradskyella psychrotolerans]
MKKITLIYYLLLLMFSSSYAQHLDDSEPNVTTNSDQLNWSQLEHYNYNRTFLNNLDNTYQHPSSLSRSVNQQSLDDILTISLVNNNTSYNQNTNDTNAPQPTLFWGNNGAHIHTNASPVILNLSEDIDSNIQSTVSYTAMQRIWKLIPVSEETPTLRIKIPKEVINNTSEIGNYYMFISDSGTFDANADFRILTLDDADNLETEYNLNGPIYVTFGYSPQITRERAIYFNGSDSYIDMQNSLDLNPNGFTVSAWIKHDSENTDNVSILSKRDVAFTHGYDLTLTNSNKINITWKNNSSQSLNSYTSIPENEWHHIAVTYDGSIASIYIDGVLDHSAEKTAPTPTAESFHIAAAGSISPIQYYKGHIDEVRIWNTSLTVDQLRFMMNQEITNDSGRVIGKELPISITKNDINTISWSDLAAYYPMTNFTFRNTTDASGNGNDGHLQHILTVDKETTPLPYKSQYDGKWTHNATWTFGSLQYIPGAVSIVNPEVTIDWNIVRTAHNISMNNVFLPAQKEQNRTILALFVDDNELKITGESSAFIGNGLTITHYLGLNGTIDLDGESQLIQTYDSDLETFTNGNIERDQQGTADTYTYNYWSSPVQRINSESNNFRITDVLKDGTDPNEPVDINFSSSGYNGAATHPITIADYWIWKYTNITGNTYSAWQHIRRTGTLSPGEGFTMKGPGTGTISPPQNYVFSGKPNNGDINLPLYSDSEYLVGNPYPSAIDALQFIKDNGPDLNNNTAPLISGTLYFWNHWGGGSHATQDYEGGYAIYNYSGAVAAAYKGSNQSLTETDGEPTKAPGRYIPVGQGFFVVGKNTGTINFNNSQRVFKKEGEASVFMRSSNTTNTTDATESEDIRMKFRIGFNSVNTIRRQLLLTIDENASLDVDWAYDGKINEEQIDDMFWLINDDAYIIQASNEAETSSIYPIGIKTKTNGINSIMIDELENVPNDINVYLHDKELGIYHDLRVGNYDIFLIKGDYLDRFEITFGTEEDLLSLEDRISNSINVLYSNAIEKIVIVNPNLLEVDTMVVFNMLGQSVYNVNTIEQRNYSEYNIKHLSAGTYIVKLQTRTGSVVTKKVLVD